MGYTLDSLSASIQLVIKEFVARHDVMNLPSGRYPIVENGIFVIVQEYLTSQSVKFEVHRKFVDVQWVIAGSEYINVCSLSEARNQISGYDEINDIEFFEEASEYKTLLANHENPVVLFPGDVHQPCMSICGRPANVRKLVFKIPISTL